MVRLGPDSGGNFEYGWSNHYLEAHVISDVGKKREHNEDSCVLCAPQDLDLLQDRGFVFAVADGMGGASAGEYASRLTLTTLFEKYFASIGGNIPEHVRQAIETANASVFEKATADPAYHGMGCTVSSVSIVGDCAYIGQVGDSRVYLWRESVGLVQLTHDHSLVAEQVRSGLISEEEARTHSLKNLITRAVGIKDQVAVDLFCLKLEKDDILLICSDGLCNMVDDESIAKSLTTKSLQGAARLLVGRALDNGGHDNITVEVIRVIDSPPKRPMHDGCTPVALEKGDGLFGRIRGAFFPRRA